MNARHAYEKIRIKFPAFSANVLEWRVLAHGDASDIARIENFLRQEFSCADLVVCVSRKVGGLMSIEEASAAIAGAIGVAEIKVANPTFTEFAVVGQPGVAAAWKQGATNENSAT